MDRIRLVYRDVDRTPLLYLLAEAAERHEQLAVEILQVADGHAYEDGFLRGDFEFICEHLRFLFPARLAGHPVRCLAACQNHSNEQLLARPGIESVEELAGGVIVLRATESSRLSALRWLRFLGLEGRVEARVIDDSEHGRWRQWQAVATGRADAVICSPLYAPPALASGLARLSAPSMPEIGSLFLAALGPFVDSHPSAIRKTMRALYRALYAVHHDAAAVLRVMAGEPAKLMGLQTDEEIRLHYEALRESVDQRPLPRIEAIGATAAMLQESDAPLAGLNPLALWDLHFALELEEQRFAERLEGEQRGRDRPR